MFLGDEEHNNPIIRPPRGDSHFSGLYLAGALFSPTAVFWLVAADPGGWLGRVAFFLGGSFLRGVGLFLFWAACALYCLDRLVKMELGIGWLITLPLFVIASLANVVLFLAAVC